MDEGKITLRTELYNFNYWYYYFSPEYAIPEDELSRSMKPECRVQ